MIRKLASIGVIALAALSVAGIFKSTDGGATWTFCNLGASDLGEIQNPPPYDSAAFRHTLATHACCARSTPDGR